MDNLFLPRLNQLIGVTYSAYNDFYFNMPSPSPNGFSWTGLKDPNTWSYFIGNINGNGFPLTVGTYLFAPDNLYSISSGSSFAGSGTTYALGGDNYFVAYTDNQGWGASLGKYLTGWVDGVPGGNGFNNADSSNQYIWMQSAYLNNNNSSPNGPAEGIATVINWTAPKDGLYNFYGAFLPANNNTSGAIGTPYEGQSLVSFAIVNSLGGTNLASQTAAQNNIPVNYNFNQYLPSGSILQFQVGTAYQVGTPVGLSVNVEEIIHEGPQIFAGTNVLNTTFLFRNPVSVDPTGLLNSVLVQNGGYAPLNGTFYFVSEFNDKPYYYKFGNNNLFIAYFDNTWGVYDFSENNGFPIYFSNEDVLYPWNVVNWSVSDSIYNPPPSVTKVL